MPILPPVQTPEPYLADEPHDPAPPRALSRHNVSVWGIGERLTWIAGLVLAISAFTGWYSGSGDGITVSVIGWHTGTVGKLVFLVGLAALALVALREAGIDLPALVPESLVVIALGTIALALVLIRLIWIPDTFFFAGRGVGIWISLAAAVGLIVAGLLEASEEL
jgi:hypothetical protein